MVTLSPRVRTELDGLIDRTLTELSLEYERVEEGVFFVALPGEHKLNTMTWVIVQDQTLLVEAFFMRKPAENEGGTYRFLLGRNSRSYGVHFCVDRVGDVYLTGRLPLSTIDADELDRVLGCVRSYSDENFDAAVQLGFAGAIRREQAWRAKLAAESRDRRPEGTGNGVAGQPAAPPA